MSKKKAYWGLAISVVVTAWTLSALYRPYVRRNRGNDFGLADTFGNLAAVIALCFLLWGFSDSSSKKKNKDIIFATIFYAFVWEPLCLILPLGTFDWKDMIASLISGAAAYGLKEAIEKMAPDSERDLQRAHPTVS